MDVLCREQGAARSSTRRNRVQALYWRPKPSSLGSGCRLIGKTKVVWKLFLSTWRFPSSCLALSVPTDHARASRSCPSPQPAGPRPAAPSRPPDARMAALLRGAAGHGQRAAGPGAGGWGAGVPGAWVCRRCRWHEVGGKKARTHRHVGADALKLMGLYLMRWTGNNAVGSSQPVHPGRPPVLLANLSSLAPRRPPPARWCRTCLRW